jgi:hypothetical protein
MLKATGPALMELVAPGVLEPLERLRACLGVRRLRVGNPLQLSKSAVVPVCLDHLCAVVSTDLAPCLLTVWVLNDHGGCGQS